MTITLPLQSFYFMRHGETDWNKTGRIMGQMDIPLNDIGRAQALEAAKLFLDKNIDIICHSPKLRAFETAQIVAGLLKVPLCSIQELGEVSLGKLEGGPKVMGLWNGYMAGETPERAESYQDFYTRTLAGTQKALEQGKNVLIVAHGGSYVALKDAVGFLGTPKANNCDIFYFKAGDKNFDVVPISA